MLTIMQKLMMKKGLIDTSMTMDELEMLIEEEDSNECAATNVGNTAVTPTPAAKWKGVAESRLQYAMRKVNKLILCLN